MTKNKKKRYLPFSFRPMFEDANTSARKVFMTCFYNIIDAQDSCGRTMAMYGAAFGDIEVLECCKRHNADFNMQDDSGWTAIMSAVVENREKAVEYLLNNVKNLDLSKKDESGKDVFQLAKHSTEKIKAMLYSYLYTNVNNPVVKQVKETNVKTRIN